MFKLFYLLFLLLINQSPIIPYLKERFRNHFDYLGILWGDHLDLFIYLLGFHIWYWFFLYLIKTRGLSQLTTCRPPPTPLKVAISESKMRNVFIIQTYEKIIFRFFEIWSNFLRKCENWSLFFIPEDVQCFETDAAPILTVLRFLVFDT